MTHTCLTAVAAWNNDYSGPWSIQPSLIDHSSPSSPQQGPHVKKSYETCHL